MLRGGVSAALVSSVDCITKVAIQGVIAAGNLVMIERYDAEAKSAVSGDRGMELFAAILVALFTSTWIAGITIKGALAANIGMDRCDAAHKTHVYSVPRLGGIAVAVAFIVGTLTLAWDSGEFKAETAFLIICVLPAFGIGLVEDLTQVLGTNIRLIFTMVSAALGWWLLDAQLLQVDLRPMDWLLGLHVGVAFMFTVVAAAGVAHAVNIVDGCNGLSSFTAVIVLGAIAAVAYQVDDQFVFSSALLTGTAVLGFFWWNFPRGRLFLGDGGAYAVGFLIAELAILLVHRNQEVSAWFPLTLMAYPVWETLYSAYRRIVIQRWAATKPDRLHLHSLVYYRLVRHLQHSNDSSQQASRSSMASTYLWVIVIGCAAVGLVFWQNTLVLQMFCLGFAVLYVLLHRSIVRFNAPKSLILRPRSVGVRAADGSIGD
jgi:UDP-GlcNAc:undecaprenyl-phosphate GlcNAc-1-phosphate transferase